MKNLMVIIQLILEFISTLTKETPRATNAKGQPVKVERISDIKKWEGLRTRAYLPTPHDVWTIGYGHTKTAYEGMVITEKQAEALLRQDLAWVRTAIAQLVKVPLSQAQYDALASFIFNLGRTNFAKSTLLKRINANRMIEAGDEFLKWDKQRQGGRMVRLQGLSNRRKHERAVWLSGTNT